MFHSFDPIWGRYRIKRNPAEVEPSATVSSDNLHEVMEKAGYPVDPVSPEAPLKPSDLQDLTQLAMEHDNKLYNLLVKLRVKNWKPRTKNHLICSVRGAAPSMRDLLDLGTQMVGPADKTTLQILASGTAQEIKSTIEPQLLALSLMLYHDQTKPVPASFGKTNTIGELLELIIEQDFEPALWPRLLIHTGYFYLSQLDDCRCPPEGCLI